jgi:hypothetical protein
MKSDVNTSEPDTELVARWFVEFAEQAIDSDSWRTGVATFDSYEEATTYLKAYSWLHTYVITGPHYMRIPKG